MWRVLFLISYSNRWNPNFRYQCFFTMRSRQGTLSQETPTSQRNVVFCNCVWQLMLKCENFVSKEKNFDWSSVFWNRRNAFESQINVTCVVNILSHIPRAKTKRRAYGTKVLTIILCFIFSDKESFKTNVVIVKYGTQYQCRRPSVQYNMSQLGTMLENTWTLDTEARGLGLQ